MDLELRFSTILKVSHKLLINKSTIIFYIIYFIINSLFASQLRSIEPGDVRCPSDPFESSIYLIVIHTFAIMRSLVRK